jgi:hypothetical protein
VTKLTVVPHTLLSELRSKVCPEGYTSLHYQLGVCIQEGWDGFARFIDQVDGIEDLALQLVLVFSDGLVVRDFLCF